MPEFDYPYDSAKFVPPPAWRPVLPQRCVWLAVLAGIGICFALIDLSFCWVASEMNSSQIGQLWMGLNLGAIGAQAGILTIYTVLGPGRIWLRHAVALLLGSASLLTWLCGYLLAKWISGNSIFPYSKVPEICAAMLVIPVLFLAGCSPLWALRTVFRWRIELHLSNHAIVKPPQLSIAGILAATTVVAIALTLVRFGAYVSEIDNESWWVGTGIGAAFTAGISLFTLPVSTWAILRGRFLAAGIIVTAVWVFLSGIGLISLISFLERNWPPREIWLNFVILLASFIAFLLLPLGVVRFFHYRLVASRQQPQSPPSASSVTLDSSGASE